MRYTLVVTMCALLLAPLFAASARELSEVEDIIVELAENVDTYTATIEMKGESADGPMKVKMEGKGTLEGMSKDDKNLYRLALDQTIDMGEQTMDHKILTVFTGDLIWTEMDMMGQTIAIKAKPETQTDMVVGSGRESFKQLREQYDMKLLPDAVVNEEPVYVLELRLKEDTDEGPGEPDAQFDKALLSFSQETGLPIKMVMLDESETPIMTLLYKDYKINPEIDATRFEYTPPEGAMVMDAEIIQQMGGMF